MASVICDANGRKRIQFTNGDGERKTIRLGKASVKDAASFALRVQAINSAIIGGTAVEPDTARWLAERPETIYKRLVRVGLAEPRVKAMAMTLDKLLAEFFAHLDVKPATKTSMKMVKARLLSHFDAGKGAAEITEEDAEEWRTKLKAEGYASATISRTVLYARQIFRWAVRRGHAKSNPFAALKAGPQVNAARQAFIDKATIAKVIDAAPDAEWKLLIALSRFGGLRVPSEALGLRWSDVDWEHNRLTVRSPKTEHHEGKGERVVPLFPEVREHLLAVFEQAPEGAVNVITRYRDGCNLNPQLRRIIRRAGLKPWDKTWHNLRASRQTELAMTFPLHTVCAWIGNTKAIAAGHYLQVTDADWTRATGGPESGAKSGAQEAQNAAQHPSAHGRAGSADGSDEPCFAGVSQPDTTERDEARNEPVGREGFEPPNAYAT
jgi:integrase